MADNEVKKGRVGKPDKVPGRMNEKTMHAVSKPEVSDLIGQRLRNYYNIVAEQPVPDRFLDLLNQLEAATSPKKPN